MTAKPQICVLDVPCKASVTSRAEEVACARCALVHACGMSGNGSMAFADVHMLVEDIGPFRSNDHVFKSGESFRNLFAVKSGMIKTVQIDAEGRAQVLGFYLPGEVVGLEAVDPGVYPCDGVALESTRLCKLPFDAVSHVAQREPEVQHHLFRMFSRAIAQHEGRSWDLGADQRVAAFLLDLSARYALRGLSPERFHLAMPRSDIANFLHLAPETVSRVLARFREQGMVDIIGREVHLQQPAALRALLKDDDA
ncbi:transcriptional regulator, Crp/Fnr family [mine drainage metagenome]|uniref:Transcriptional regulator, Crp/Fnr family n=1 Tax=mine drainage metagenome TaxID=410659 RepID=T1AVT1_9ZZZZ